MATCDQPERFKEILTYAFVALMIFYVVYPELILYAWGSNLDENIATEMLPADSILVNVLKFVFSLNVVCSIPIVINPTNTAVERWLCSCVNKKTTTYYWLQNLSRTLVILSSIGLGLALAEKLDKFLGIMGSLLCAPLALTFPALLHLKKIAKTRTEKCFDWFMIVLSLCLLVFCTA